MVRPPARRRSSYGNNATYLTARIAYERPDILERMKVGEYQSVYSAAIDAGIPHVIRRSPRNPDRVAERLIRAWENADFEAKVAFCILCDPEIEAVREFLATIQDGGEEEAAKATAESQFLKRRRGQAPFVALGDPIPAIEAAIAAGVTVSEIARRLGVAYNTVNRWRRGRSKPSPALMAKIQDTVFLSS
jgi:hypothetical protein